MKTYNRGEIVLVKVATDHQHLTTEGTECRVDMTGREMLAQRPAIEAYVTNFSETDRESFVLELGTEGGGGMIATLVHLMSLEDAAQVAGLFKLAEAGNYAVLNYIRRAFPDGLSLRLDDLLYVKTELGYLVDRSEIVENA